MRNMKKIWLEKGYTQEQIENHLSFRRYKAKQSRDKKAKNNIKNKEIIRQIKLDLLGKTFEKNKIISINPTVDGRGFWCKVYKTFDDESSGYFRYFFYFDDYSLKEFISII